MRAFTILWAGQLLSLLGSAMTRFVLAIWLWQQTGQATALVLVGVFTGIASLAANLAAGPVVDRVSRKRLIILADLLAGLTTLTLLLLAAAGQLASWQIYLVSALSGVFGTFHYLAFTTSVTLLIPKKHYTRANSMLALAHYSAAVLAPLLAGILIGPIGIAGVMVFDLATLIFALASVSLVAFPRVKAEKSETQNSWSEGIFGIRYIFSRPPLRGLLLVMSAFILFESFGYPLISPMILARTGGDEVTLGVVQSVLGIGGVVGGAAVAVWGGFRRKIHGVLISLLLTGLLGDTLMGLGSGLLVWIPAAIFLELFIPLAISSNNAIWQAKVPPEQQGRVFAARSLVANLGEPAALLCTGLLADRVFEPAMRSGGYLADWFGPLVGAGPGAGMGLLLVLCGMLSAATAVWGYLRQPVREVESLLPDHEAIQAAEAGAGV
jgi:MFS family permease